MRTDLRPYRFYTPPAVTPVQPFLDLNGKYNAGATVYVNNVAWVDASANNTLAEIGNIFRPFTSVSNAVDVLPTDSTIYLISDSGGDLITTKNITIVGAGSNGAFTDLLTGIGADNSIVEIRDCNILLDSTLSNGGKIVLKSCIGVGVTLSTGEGTCCIYNSKMTSAVHGLTDATNSVFESTVNTKNTAICFISDTTFKNSLKLRDRSGGVMRNVTFITGANTPITWDAGFNVTQSGGQWDLYDVTFDSSAAFCITENAFNSGMEMNVYNISYTTTGFASLIQNFITVQSNVMRLTNGNVEHLDEDIEISNTLNGVILTSPDASRYRITIDNAGTLITTSI